MGSWQCIVMILAESRTLRLAFVHKKAANTCHGVHSGHETLNNAELVVDDLLDARSWRERKGGRQERRERQSG